MTGGHVIVLGVTAIVAFVGGVFIGERACKPEQVVVTPPVIRIKDTVEVPPKWMTDLIVQMEKDLAKKPRRDTLFLATETLVRDSFPYPVYVTDTSSRFWWVERATFGQKPNDVTTVVTREPRSGQATVLRYQTPGPVLSFVVDTAPRPKISFGTFVQPKKSHGIFTDLAYITGSFATGSLSGFLIGRGSCGG